MAEKVGIDPGRYARFGAAVTLGLTDGFLFSQIRNIGTIYEERGRLEGTKNLALVVGFPVAAATLTYAVTRRIELASAAALGAYLFEGFLSDFQEFQFSMQDQSYTNNLWFYKLARSIYPVDGYP